MGKFEIKAESKEVVITDAVLGTVLTMEFDAGVSLQQRQEFISSLEELFNEWGAESFVVTISDAAKIYTQQLEKPNTGSP